MAGFISFDLKDWEQYKYLSFSPLSLSLSLFSLFDCKIENANTYVRLHKNQKILDGSFTNEPETYKFL